MNKYHILTQYMKTLAPGAVLFSGGMDSSLVLFAAREVWGDRAAAVTFRTPTLTERDRMYAERFLARLGMEAETIPLNNLLVPEVRDNRRDRCYFCKKALLEKARSLGLPLYDGTNRDDAGLYRPGLRAKEEAGVISPLADCGLGKEDIRECLTALGLEEYVRASDSCLATRVPYDCPIAEESLERVRRAEALVISLLPPGAAVRCRVKGEAFSVETEKRYIPILRGETKALEALGAYEICEDGFVSGRQDK
ncbi:MAG: TIGR00268 family protein [Abditibacteriota bacterium]|nr:TIGR00268 family protein [Abditibacteriota bacterium]